MSFTFLKWSRSRQSSAKARVAPRAHQRILEPRDQLGAVRQAGQRVVPRKVADAGLGLAPVGDVLHHHDAAAAAHGPARDQQDAPAGGFLGFARLAGAHHAAPLGQHLRGRAAGEVAERVAQADHVRQGYPRAQPPRRQAEQFAHPFVDHDEVLGAVIHAKAVRHVVQRGLEAHRLDADLGEQAFEFAVGALELLGHQGHGPVGPAALALGFLVAGQHQRAEAVDVGDPRGVPGARDLAIQQPRHGRSPGGGHAASRNSVTVMVWLCSSQWPAPARGASSP